MHLQAEYNLLSILMSADDMCQVVSYTRMLYWAHKEQSSVADGMFLPYHDLSLKPVMMSIEQDMWQCWRGFMAVLAYLSFILPA